MVSFMVSISLSEKQNTEYQSTVKILMVPAGSQEAH